MQFNKMLTGFENQAGIAPIFYAGIRSERDSTVETGLVSAASLA